MGCSRPDDVGCRLWLRNLCPHYRIYGSQFEYICFQPPGSTWACNVFRRISERLRRRCRWRTAFSASIPARVTISQHRRPALEVGNDCTTLLSDGATLYILRHLTLHHRLRPWPLSCCPGREMKYAASMCVSAHATGLSHHLSVLLGRYPLCCGWERRRAGRHIHAQRSMSMVRCMPVDRLRMDQFAGTMPQRTRWQFCSRLIVGECRWFESMVQSVYCGRTP